MASAIIGEVAPCGSTTMAGKGRIMAGMGLRTILQLVAATFFVESTTAGPLAADESPYTGQARTGQARQGDAVATQTRGAHSVRGSIRTIDHNTGMINLETEVGVVEVQASPEAVQDWQEGDQVVVKFEAAE